MIKSNPDNIWKLTTRKGEEYFIKCPSKSGAKIFLAERIGIKENCPFKSEFYLEHQVPEGCEILQAHFRQANDPKNWEAGNV